MTSPEELITLLEASEDKFREVLCSLSLRRKDILRRSLRIAEERAEVETQWTEFQTKLLETQRMLISIRSTFEKKKETKE